jgi:hypothetical protein
MSTAGILRRAAFLLAAITLPSLRPAVARAQQAAADTGTSLRFRADLRGRFDGVYGSEPSLTNRQRFRYRLRGGVLANLPRGFEAEVRLTSAEETDPSGGDPISGNTSFGDNGSKKGIFIDLAYLRWTPQVGDRPLVLAFGKMNNPFDLSDMVFDGDYTPEGGALTLDVPLARGTALRLAAGGFQLDENSSTNADPYLTGGQLQLRQALGERTRLTAGGGMLRIAHAASLANAAVPNGNVGNSRNDAGELVFEYTPYFAQAALSATTVRAPGFGSGLPMQLSAEYLDNSKVDERGTAWSVGATLGRAAAARSWDLGYRYKYIERDAWYEEMVDSDFGAFYAAPLPGAGNGAGYRPGTNTKGHVMRVQVAPYDFAVVTATLYAASLVDFADPVEGSAAQRLQVDVTLRF